MLVWCGKRAVLGGGVTFAGDGVKKVDTAKSAGGDGVDAVLGTLELHLGVAADVGKDVALAHFDEGQLGVVAVGKEICKSVSEIPSTSSD